MAATVHLYEIFIKAPQQRVWDALTDPDFTERYFHQTRIESDWAAGAGYRMVLPDGREAIDGTVEEIDPPNRLVLTWHVLYDAAMAEEPPGRVEWSLQPANDDGSVTRVTLRHGDLALSPLTWQHTRLGWVAIIDSLKSLLETGHALPEVEATAEEAEDVEGQWHRSQAITANNSVWELLDGRAYSPGDTDDLLGRAYAAAYHWGRATGAGSANAARASWLLSRSHAVLGHGQLALHHAERSAAHVAGAGLEDFDLGYAHEAKARALACLGRTEEARAERDQAAAVPIADADDRSIFEADLESEPWYGL